MRRVLLLVSIVALITNVGYTKTQEAEPAKQVRAGDVVPFGETLFVRASKATNTFEGIKVKGEPLVVVLEMESGKKGVTLFYKLTADSGSSQIYLLSGAHKIAPSAVIEDFPSWGRDNDKEVDKLDPKDTVGGVTLSFQQKGSISLLFDVPVADAKAQKKLSVVMRMVQPKDEQQSFVVSL